MRILQAEDRREVDESVAVETGVRVSLCVCAVRPRGEAVFCVEWERVSFAAAT